MYVQMSKRKMALTAAHGLLNGPCQGADVIGTNSYKLGLQSLLNMDFFATHPLRPTGAQAATAAGECCDGGLPPCPASC